MTASARRTVNRISCIQVGEYLLNRSEEIKNVVRILRCFEGAADLKLNLRKSENFGINVNDALINQWASILHCKSEKLSFLYLGLPLGASKNSNQLWSPVVDKLQMKLSV
ncbi:hypothetical protein V6N13_121908 [Hibiscus sabdariffa]